MKWSYKMNWKKIESIRKEAKDIIEARGCKNAYELATDILYQLSAYKGYCIWQAYTVDNVEANIGRKPTRSEMQELADNLQCFENIRTV